MKFSTIVSALALAAPAFAVPAKRAIDPTDLLVLQFALTLEHLENAFYSRFLRKLGAEKDFGAIGLPQPYQYKLRFIASDEKSHVKLLSDVIAANGATPVKQCTYTFSDQDLTASQFLTLSTVLEGVGTSAYLGAAKLISDKGYLTAAGSILVTEALHTSFQRDASKLIPFATPYGTPLDPKSVFTLAASFIKSCPSSDPKADSTKVLAGFAGQSPLTAQTTGPVAQGSTVSYTSAKAPSGETFLTYIYGLTVTSVPADTSGSTASSKVPADAAGQVYVLLTSSAATNNDASTVAMNIISGPAIIEVTPSEPCFLSVAGCGIA